MLKKKKQLSHEDITEEDIRKHINRHKMLNKHVETHIISKSITWITLFFVWVFFTAVVKSIQIRYALIIIGLPLLLILFQTYIVHPRKNSQEHHIHDHH